MKQRRQDNEEKWRGYGKESDWDTKYVKGAKIAGLMKVAKAMMAQGIL